MSYSPLADRVLLEQSDAEEVTKSGIVLPDAAQEKPQEAVVVEVGPGRITDEGKTVPMSVKKGDVVIFSKYGGTNVKVEDKEYLIVKESDILAIRK
tara:strand:- start:522 stop:809 length:288 start_codon:yes stop_codon:yes gene_type:complete